jgi:hypothetical protein
MRSFIKNDFEDWLKDNGREIPMMPMPGDIHGEA